MRKVLLLDDETAVLSVLSDYLEHPGVEIVTCQEIEAAEAALAGGPFDVVVTDLRVSELGGLEGMRLIRYVSANFPRTTVVAMSGFVNDDVHRLGRLNGATAVLEKPIDLQRLKKYVHGDDLPTEGESTIAEIPLLDTFLEKREITAYFQPIVTIAQGKEPYEAYGYESLARAPIGTPLRNPEILFAYAAKKERLFKTDLLCIEAALSGAQAMGLRRGDSKLFINTQPRSMTDPDFTFLVTEAIEKAGFKNEDIVFELTEQQTIVNPKAFARTLGEIRDRGFEIALDDYGVGFANLRLVQDLKPEYIKLSGFFCKDIHKDEFKQTLVRSTSEMCDRLSIPIILENVESDDELEVVKDLGVTYGQGYHFTRPQPAKELMDTQDFRPPQERS